MPAAQCEPDRRIKRFFFWAARCSAVLSMQDVGTRSCLSLCFPGSASFLDALLWGRFLFDPCKGMRHAQSLPPDCPGSGVKQSLSLFPKSRAFQ
jgi:hypothetical protein